MHSSITHTARKTVISCWWILKVTYGLLFVVAGIDKFFNMITAWEKYICPYVLNIIKTTHNMMVHMSPTQLIHIVGIIEIGIGLITLFIWTRLGAYLTALWLCIIVINLLCMRMYFDIAVRDVVMAIGAIVLAQLTIIKHELEERS